MINLSGAYHSVFLRVDSVSLCATNNYTEFHRDLKRTTEIKTEIMELNKITGKIIGCAIQVHRHGMGRGAQKKAGASAPAFLKIPVRD